MNKQNTNQKPQVPKKVITQPSTSTSKAYDLFLYGPKLRSEIPFFLILEYLPLGQLKFKSPLSMLNPLTSEHMYKQILRRKEFDKHKLMPSESFNVSRKTFIKAEKQPGWVPNKIDLLKMSKDVLDKQGMRQIEYKEFDGLLRLTFMFGEFKSGNLIRSPPKGTYVAEPNQKFILPENGLGGISFGVQLIQKQFYLTSMLVYDGNSDLVHEVRHNRTVDEFDNFILDSGEQVVSANIETEYNLAQKITFLVYTDYTRALAQRRRQTTCSQCEIPYVVPQQILGIDQSLNYSSGGDFDSQRKSQQFQKQTLMAINN